MSFLRHERIYQSDGLSLGQGRNKQSPASPLPHRLDESATGYSLAGCSPALPASASPAGFHAAPYQPKQSSTIEQAWQPFDRRNHFWALDTQKSSCRNSGRRGTTIHVLG